MKIKVCGNTSVEQLKQLQEIDIDYAGLIFFEGSKRNAGEKIKEQKEEIKKTIIKKIGVFVNETMETIEQAIEDYTLYAVQLHGDETDEFCLELMDKVKVIKVFKVAGEEDVDAMIKPFQNVCHYYLFDTAPVSSQDKNVYGGTGKKFDWNILESAVINKPFFLSGGIDIKDVEKVKLLDHPCLYAVDINSCFEISPGIKNISLVKQFKDELWRK